MKGISKSAFNHNSYESFMYKAGKLAASANAKGMMMNLLKTGQSLSKLSQANVKRVVAPVLNAVKPSVKADTPRMGA